MTSSQSIQEMNAFRNPPGGQVVQMNFLDRLCVDPFLHNGDSTQTRLPLEATNVRVLDGEVLATPPSIEVEGFCRVKHEADVAGLDYSAEAMKRYRDSLISFMKQFSGADEIVMFPNCLIRRQENGATPDRKNAANYLHADVTVAGAMDMETYLYPPRTAEVRRVAHFNMWRLLSKGPTNLPLAMCDVRSVRLGDVIEGSAYFPSIEREIGTGFFHPTDHFRLIYFSKLQSNQMLVFKQFDSDPNQPSSVPHGAFIDPSAPSNAEPRVSIEARCLARWYR